MDEQKAEDLGRAAREANLSASPFVDPEMSAELDGARVGEKTHLMKAFARGWHDQNDRITDLQLRDEGVL